LTPENGFGSSKPAICPPEPKYSGKDE
jgi:hypothetical protein